MCGIVLVVHSPGWGTGPLPPISLEMLRRRGPDHLGTWSTRFDEATVTLYASVLYIRGVCPQPVELASGSVIAWNGEIFDFSPVNTDELFLPLCYYTSVHHPRCYYTLSTDENDTQWLAKACPPTLEDANIASLLELLRRIRGPFAFVYVCPKTGKVLCVRDILGRRSLCIQTSEAGVVVSSSALDGGCEIPVNQAWILDVRTASIQKLARAHESPFHSSRWWASALISTCAPFLFRRALEESVRRRMHHKMGILFSGGLDSTVLAALAAPYRSDKIDLINVAFDPKEAPDRHTALLSYEELQRIYGDAFRLILVDVDEQDVVMHEKHVLQAVGPDHQKHMDFNIAAALWFAARARGVVCENPQVDGVEVRPKRPPPHQVEAPQPCDFCQLRGKPRCVFRACKLCCRKLLDQQDGHKMCPVHRSGRSAKEEKPLLNMEAMQLAVGKTYCSDARVLLLGTGADELLGGYARHLSSYKCRGQEGLKSEMKKDLERLWTRNLGRDDRIISDLGREARHPFLDEQFIHLLSMVKPVVDKQLLRDLARTLGLSRAAEFEKRAIQFGSRIAQQSNRRTCGFNRRADGQGQYKARDDV